MDVPNKVGSSISAVTQSQIFRLTEMEAEENALNQDAATLMHDSVHEEIKKMKERQAFQEQQKMAERPKPIARQKIPIFDSSRMFRRPSAHDLRLTPSDHIHDLIMKNAEEAYQRSLTERNRKRRKKRKEKEERAKKEEEEEAKKPFDKQKSIALVIPEIPEEPDRLPKLGIPALDRSEASLHGGKRDSSEIIKSITYLQQPSSVSTGQSMTVRTADIELSKAMLQRKSIEFAEPILPPKKAPEERRTSGPSIFVKGRKTKVVPKDVVEKRHKRRFEERIPSTTANVTDEFGGDLAAKKSAAAGQHVSLVQVFGGNLQPKESWVNSIWVEELDKREQESELAAERQQSEDEIRRRLKNIRNHRRTRLHKPREYHPYAQRKNPRGLTNCGAIALLIKALLASGTLKTPLPYAYIGHYSSVIPTVILLVWVTGTLHMYFTCRQQICKNLRTPYLSFSETMREAFLLGPGKMPKHSKFFSNAVNFVMVYHQVVVLMKYCIFAGSYAVLTFNSSIDGAPSSVHVVPFMILSILILYIKTLNKFVLIAFIGNVLACIHYAIVLFQLTGTLVGHDKPDETYHYLPSGPFIYFMGHMLTLTDCIAAVLVIEERMKHPRGIRGYSGILNLSLLFAGLWFIMIGFFGVRQFGNDITLRYIRDLDLGKHFYIFLYVTYCIVLLGAFGVQSFFSIEVLWKLNLAPAIKSSKYQCCWETLLRTAYATLPFILIYQPRIIVSIIMFLGYIVGPFLTLFCPVLAHFCWCWSQRTQGIYKLKIFGDLVLLALSVLGILATIMWFYSRFDYKYITVAAFT